MAIRFTSFEFYKKLLANKETGKVAGQSTFIGKDKIPIIGEMVKRWICPVNIETKQLVYQPVSRKQWQS